MLEGLGCGTQEKSGKAMTPIKQLAEEAAREYWDITYGRADDSEELVKVIERALTAQQAEHEAERDAAVADALETAAKVCLDNPEATAAYLFDAIRALKPRTDMVCVPPSLAERTEAMFRSVDPKGVISQQWTELLAAKAHKEKS